ncbi:MAG: peptidase S58 family protein, partial [Spirochaetaceae bacterium]
MQQVNAILMTGGSAFGLAAAEGIVKYLGEHDMGYETPWGKVPIVPGAVIFDLNVGDSSIRPTQADAYLACKEAVPKNSQTGRIGAGTGATIGKWQGFEARMPGGLGCAEIIIGDLIVSAVAVVNAVGDVIKDDGHVLCGAKMPDGTWCAENGKLFGSMPLPSHTNTTLVTVATNAIMTKTEVYSMCRRSQTGMARAIKPVHTSHDGD